MTVFEELTRRGLIAQMTHPEKIRELLDHEKVTSISGSMPLRTACMWVIFFRWL